MRSEAWRPVAAACNRSPREARDPALQALRPGCEELAVTDPAQMPVREARPRSPKAPRWSAERRASRVMGRKAPRKRLACRVMANLYMALYTTPSGPCNTLGSRNLILWRSIALHGATLLYFGHLPDTGAHSLPKPRNAKLESATARRKFAVRKKPYYVPALARHRARLPPQRWGGQMGRAGGRWGCRVDQEGRARR